jgi:hypothetical protein
VDYLAASDDVVAQAGSAGVEAEAAVDRVVAGAGDASLPPSPLTVLLPSPALTVSLPAPASILSLPELDGLTALRDRERVEAEALPLQRPSTYLEPFALRALGIVREDAALIEQATARFEAMGLDWHAAETRRLAGAR